MSKNLLIVESPSKARTIKKYLGQDFEVLASVGHIKDLPTKELGVDVENGFKPKYVAIRGKSKIVKQLKDAAKDAETIYLAPDPDREGEAIAWHIAETLNVPKDKIKRVLFNEITRSGVWAGIRNPLTIDKSRVDAQQARRVLDRIVGYQVSPFLWKTLFRGLSAGRVQSVAVRLICEREAEIEAFVPKEYWNLFADLKTQSKEFFTAKCIKINDKKAVINNEDESKEHLENLNNADYIVNDIQEKVVKKSPAPPFTTSTLQQDATRQIKFPPKKTMVVAQQLYEGVDIKGEPTGLITYMRTDSVRISNEATEGAREFIQNAYGENYLPEKARHYKSSKKNVQDAHEGIRPTRFDLPPEKVKDFLSGEQMRLYSLIWKRFIACQMQPALYNQKIIDVKAKEYLFRATGRDLAFDGYLKAYRGDKDVEEKEQKIPSVINKDESLVLEELKPEQKFTEPPARYSDGTLVKELDNLGIGRPSTYASIISTIMDRKYVERKSGSLIPTELGRTVNGIVVKGMPEIFSVEFTSLMENDLDEVEAGQRSWKDLMNEFYQPFRSSLDSLEEKRKEIKESLQEVTEEKCEKCGEPMVIKWSKNGKFMACSGFPDCRNTKPLDADENAVTETKPCPKCGGDMQVKDGRYGKFWACTNYPKCKTTEPFTLDIPCPEEGCEGKLVQRKTKRGKTFYGCDQYPKCKFATWNEPVNQKCDSCGHKILEKKTTKKDGEKMFCPACKTEYPIIKNK